MDSIFLSATIALLVSIVMNYAFFKRLDYLNQLFLNNVEKVVIDLLEGRQTGKPDQEK